MPIVNLSNYTRCWSCNRAMHTSPSADVELFGNRAHMCQECYERADAQASQGECNQQVTQFIGTPITRAKWEMPTKDEARACHSAYFFHPSGQVDAMLEALNKFVALRNSKL